MYQQGVRNKTKSMKAMASELNMYQVQVNEYKYELERLTRELQEVKRQYYEQKRVRQSRRSHPTHYSHPSPTPSRLTPPHLTHPI